MYFEEVGSRDLMISLLCQSVKMKRFVTMNGGSFPEEHFEKPPRIA